MDNQRSTRVLVLFIFIAIFIISLDTESSKTRRKNEEEFRRVVAWLKEKVPGSEKNKQAFYNAGVIRLANLCLLRADEFKYISAQSYWRSSSILNDQLHELKRQEAFKYWLKNQNMEDLYVKLSDSGTDTLEKIASNLDYEKASTLIENDQKRLQNFWRALEILKQRKHLGFDNYPVGVEVSFLTMILKYLWMLIVIIAKLALFIFGAAFILVFVFAAILTRLIARLFRSNTNNGQMLARILQIFTQSNRPPFRRFPVPEVQPRQGLPRENTTQGGFWQRFFNSLFSRGNNNGNWVPYDARRTKLIFSWNEDPAVVGEMRSFTMTFYKNLISVCPNCQIDNANAKITVDGVDVPCTIEKDGLNAFVVKFTPLISGAYSIAVFACGKHVKTHHKSFLPGLIDPSKTTLKVARSTVVMQENKAAEILLDERDKYNNKCYSKEESLTKYCFKVNEINEEMAPANPEIRVVHQVDRIAISTMFADPGCYKLTVTYDQQPIMKNIITLIVLNREHWNKMKSDVKKQSWNLWYEAYLLPNEESPNNYKKRKVYCYITSKMLTIKEFYLKIIPKRLHTLRIRPSTKLTLLPRKHDETGYFILKIEENIGIPIVLACKERNMFAATFTQMLLGSVGGFDSFENKRKHLYSELRKIYSKRSTLKTVISVNRETLLRDSMKATKSFTDSDWGKGFSIVFLGENGLDYGGLKREWFQLNCDALFNSKNTIFQKLGKDDAQSLIHPNPFRSEKFQSLKYFEFAGKIVGKLLIDCAFDNGQYIRARFSRSFLSQILGLGVCWRHFETDDKEFYKTKVNYILKNDIEDLELTFTEDVYDHNQTFIKTVDLKQYGSQISVNNENKMKYLQLVAEYRLVNSVKDEITAFLKGLNSLVPDRLLSIFDENELELLICGTENISVTDLQDNFAKCLGGGPQFDKVLQWFWEILLSFNQEELSRLVQFTTGCSQLPPGGFKDLSPKFQILSHPGFNALPSAHTCFNMLCLPDYSSKEEFRRLLTIALNEGSEGFGLA